MSDTVWATLISVIGMLGTTYLTNWFNSRSAKRAADIAADQSATQWERSESTRHDQEAKDEARRREELQAARLRTCWENALAASERVKRLPQIYGNGREPSVYSAHACAVALQGLKTVYPLAKVFHEATVLLQINAREVGFPAVPVSLLSWGKSLAALEYEIGRLSGVVVKPDAAVPDSAAQTTGVATKPV